MLLSIIQIIVSILIIIGVLLQQRGSGLSSSIGGAGGFYSTRRGVEKRIFWSTVVLIIVFIGLSILNLFYSF